MIARWLEGHLWWVMSTFGIAMTVALALIVVLFVQLHQTRTDLERVEGGAAFFAWQVQALREPLVELEPELRGAIDDAIAGLDSMRTASLEVTLPAGQSIDIETEFEVVRDVVIPVNTSFPVNQSFDTTVQIQGPFGVAVPVDVTVPIEIDVPVELDLVLPIDETVPIRVTIPLGDLGPLTVDFAQTGLDTTIDSLVSALRAVRDLLAGLR